MAKQHPPTVLFAAGGTGGHIYPAIAVADAMREIAPDLRAVFVGTSHGLEQEIVPRHGYDLELIDVRFLKGVPLLKKIRNAALLPRSAWQSWRLLRRYKPGLVLGAGGYASGPVTGIAALTGRPTAILEQNAIPGLTNRVLGRFVDRIFVSFEAERYPNFKPEKVRPLGNPVRPMIVETPDIDRQPGKTHVLIVGGSQGAGSLNEHMARIVAGLGDASADLVVRHQTGRGRDAPVRDAWSGVDSDVTVTEFIHDMPGAYAWADIIVCRAGATTVAELQAAGKAAILVPFPHAAHNHQEKNALAVVEAGAGLMVLDDALTGDRMTRLLAQCINNPSSVHALAANASRIAQPDAARAVARECLQMMGFDKQGAAGRLGSAQPQGV